MRPIKLAFLICAMMCIYSCDCFYHMSAVVLDKTTKQPIDSVSVKMYKNSGVKYSDLNGSFDLHEMGGGVMGCPIRTVTLAKKGYKDTTLIFSGADKKTIYLEKNN
jgi:hypothetical protein